MRFARPRLVDDAVQIADNGLNVGVYGPFRLYTAYQPIYEQGDAGRLVIRAFEGLIRPFANDRFVRPDRFLESIHEDDYLFIECMCRALHLRNYPQAVPRSRALFVNLDLARYQNRHEMKLNFDIYCQRAARHGLTIENMVFEVLESEPADEGLLEYTRDLLKDRGVRIAVDDFGQKHSNMDRCMVLKPDILKIDRQLFLRAIGNETLFRILKIQIGQFHDLGTTVLIEGIETLDQMEMAQKLGADLFQGFLFSKPTVLPARFEDLSLELIDNAGETSGVRINPVPQAASQT